MKNPRLGLVLAAGLVVGCVAGKDEVDEDFSDLAALDSKSDAFSYRLRLLGPLVSDQPQTVLYTQTPRFRGFELDGVRGDLVDVWVRGPRGDALLWLLDSSFHVVDRNDDADDSTRDAHITATLPKDGRYYVVFRDYYLESRRFTVELTREGAERPFRAPIEFLTDRLTTPGYDYRVDHDLEVSLDGLRGTMPAHVAAFYRVATPESGLVEAWHMLVNDVSYYAIIVGVDQRAYVHLFDAEGGWLDHANGAHDGSQISNLVWGVRDLVDHTVCACDGGGLERCTWEDGSSEPGEQPCD